MLRAVGVREAIFQESVHKGIVAVFAAFAEGGEVVGDVGHGFRTASHDDGGVAGHDCLGREDKGLGSGSADFVHGGADGGICETGVDGALAGGVLAETVRIAICELLTRAREGSQGSCDAHFPERTFP